MTTPFDPAGQRPDAILSRVTAELRQCHAMLHGVETAVAPILGAVPTAGNSHALQDIDRLGQTLADLATCLDALGAALCNAPAIDARALLGAVRLDDLAQRLRGRSVPPAPVDARVALF